MIYIDKTQANTQTGKPAIRMTKSMIEVLKPNELAKMGKMNQAHSTDNNDLRKNSISLFAKYREAAEEFSALISNISMDMAKMGYFKKEKTTFSNWATVDGEDVYGPDEEGDEEKEQTFFGKLWSSIKDPLISVISGIAQKAGGTTQAANDTNALVLELERDRINQQQQMTQYLLYGGIAVAVIIVLVIVSKSKGIAPAAPAAA